MEKIETVKGWDYMSLALYAFAGLGLEALLAFLIEPMLYGLQMSEWTVMQSVSHWTITCIMWGIVGLYLVKIAKNKYGFDIMEKAYPMQSWQWFTVIICVIFTLVLTYLDWDGIKVVKEYTLKGPIKFTFQYIYYLFETGLFMLIIVFGQKACEKWFNQELIPYGGIVTAITWGLAHIFTKGDLLTGLFAMFGGFIFGVVYLLVNRDVKKTFVLLFIMFAF